MVFFPGGESGEDVPTLSGSRACFQDLERSSGPSLMDVMQGRRSLQHAGIEELATIDVGLASLTGVRVTRCVRAYSGEFFGVHNFKSSCMM